MPSWGKNVPEHFKYGTCLGWLRAAGGDHLIGLLINTRRGLVVVLSGGALFGKNMVFGGMLRWGVCRKGKQGVGLVFFPLVGLLDLLPRLGVGRWQWFQVDLFWPREGSGWWHGGLSVWRLSVGSSTTVNLLICQDGHTYFTISYTLI